MRLEEEGLQERLQSDWSSPTTDLKQVFSGWCTIEHSVTYFVGLCFFRYCFQNTVNKRTSLRQSLPPKKKGVKGMTLSVCYKKWFSFVFWGIQFSIRSTNQFSPHLILNYSLHIVLGAWSPNQPALHGPHC